MFYISLWQFSRSVSFTYFRLIFRIFSPPKNLTPILLLTPKTRWSLLFGLRGHIPPISVIIPGHAPPNNNNLLTST